jgi:WD40 repeat protein
MSDKLLARKQREAEIAAMALEMSTSVPQFVKKRTNNVLSGLVEGEDNDNVNTDDLDGDVQEEEDEDDDDEKDSETDCPPHESESRGNDVQLESQSIYLSKLSGESEFEAFAMEKKVPISHQVDLVGHTKAVACVAIEPAGNRLVTGSLDYNIKMFDFGGMDTRHRPFYSVEVEEGHPVTSISHSPSGDKFIVSTGSSQPRVYDREGKDIIKFVKGDMYLRDLANTKGHVMEVTCVCWHPIEKNIMITSSLDGTIRLWDLQGEAAFGNLINKNVFKIRTTTGQGRLGCTSCVYTPSGSRIYGGCSDGSIHAWIMKVGSKQYSREDAIFTVPASCKGPVICVTISKDSNVLATRTEGGNVTLWDITKIHPVLFRVIIGIDNTYAYANVEFSPDGSLICLGTSPPRENTTAKGAILFFHASKPIVIPKQIPVMNAIDTCMRVGVMIGVSIIAIKWQSNTKQIVCTASNGLVRVFFDPRFSVKGALISAGKAPKRELDPTDFAIIGEIITPNALPLFRDAESNAGKLKYMDRKDPIKSKMPEKNLNKGPGKSVNNSFFFTQYISEGRNLDNLRTQDPREALLKYDAQAKADPMFLGPAYETSQPKTQLSKLTFEQEQEEFRKKQKHGE